jgi:hypothetical protein
VRAAGDALRNLGGAAFPNGFRAHEIAPEQGAAPITLTYRREWPRDRPPARYGQATT